MREVRAAMPADPGLLDLDIAYIEVAGHVYRIRLTRHYRLRRSGLYLLVTLFLALCGLLGVLSALALWPAIVR